MANREYIHEIYFEGGEATSFSGDTIEAATGLDFLYRYKNYIIARVKMVYLLRSSLGFWSDTSQDKIYRATLNGTDVEELINSSILAVGECDY